MNKYEAKEAKISLYGRNPNITVDIPDSDLIDLFSSAEPIVQEACIRRLFRRYSIKRFGSVFEFSREEKRWYKWEEDYHSDWKVWKNKEETIEEDIKFFQTMDTLLELLR
jgi:hypothetical protein